jgi:O-antigen/teichoic acid export membrane protein
VTPDAALNPLDEQQPTQPSSTAGMTTKVVKGSIWTLAGQVAPLAVSLVTTPFVIRMLGAESYGVLVLVGLIPVYLGFADFGMAVASTKFASEAFAEGDRAKEARVVRTAALVALLFSIPIAALLFIFADRVVGLFNVPEALLSDAALALRFASVTLVVNFLNGILNAPELARLRMDLNTAINATFRIASLIAMPIAIFVTGRISTVALVLLVIGVLNLVAHVIVSVRLLPDLQGTSVESRLIRRLLTFGLGLLGAGLAATLLVNAEKGILTKIVSVESLAYYSVAYTLASTLTFFPVALMQSLLPAFSQLQGEKKRIELNTLYERGIRMNLIWVAPAIVSLSLISRPFFSIWAGEEFGRQSTAPFHILLIGLTFTIVGAFPYTAILASGRSDALATLYWIELLIHLAVASLLILNFGIIGAAVSWSIRAVLDTVAMFFLAKRFGGAEVAAGKLVRTSLVCAMMLVPLCLNLYFGITNIILVLAVGVCFVVYGLAVWRFALRPEEIGWLFERLAAYRAMLSRG